MITPKERRRADALINSPSAYTAFDPAPSFSEETPVERQQQQKDSTDFGPLANGYCSQYEAYMIGGSDGRVDDEATHGFVWVCETCGVRDCPHCTDRPESPEVCWVKRSSQEPALRSVGGCLYCIYWNAVTPSGHLSAHAATIAEIRRIVPRKEWGIECAVENNTVIRDTVTGEIVFATRVWTSQYVPSRRNSNQSLPRWWADHPRNPRKPKPDGVSWPQEP